MDTRVLQLSDVLLLIERELRVQGWWAGTPPSASALASVEPFAVDVMAFEEWLQWIFLPKMKFILEQGAQLPAVSGIQPMAEMVFRERLTQARGLLEALGEFDRLIAGA